MSLELAALEQRTLRRSIAVTVAVAAFGIAFGVLFGEGPNRCLAIAFTADLGWAT